MHKVRLRGSPLRFRVTHIVLNVTESYGRHRQKQPCRTSSIIIKICLVSGFALNYHVIVSQFQSAPFSIAFVVYAQVDSEFQIGLDETHVRFQEVKGGYGKCFIYYAGA